MSTTEHAPVAVRSTYDWLAQTPLAASAGATFHSWYQTSKNYCRMSQYTLGAVESTAQYLAGVAAPFVARPARAVDSFLLKMLETAEEKVLLLREKSGQLVSKSKCMVSDVRSAVVARSDAVFQGIRGVNPSADQTRRPENDFDRRGSLSCDTDDESTTNSNNSSLSQLSRDSPTLPFSDGCSDAEWDCYGEHTEPVPGKLAT